MDVQNKSQKFISKRNRFNFGQDWETSDILGYVNDESGIVGLEPSIEAGQPGTAGRARGR